MFLRFSGRAFTPQKLLDLSIPGLTNSGAQVVEKDVREVGGKQAMWLVVERKSKTGFNLTDTGNVATRQLWGTVPRIHNGNQNIVVFLLNAQTTDDEARVQEVQAMLRHSKSRRTKRREMPPQLSITFAEIEPKATTSTLRRLY